MARRGWSTSNFLRYSAGLITATPLTIAAWAKTSVATTKQYIAGLFASGTASEDNCFCLNTNNDTIQARAADSVAGGVAVTSTTLTTNTWFHACGVFASATDRRVFLNGGGKGTQTTSRIPAGIDRTSIGVGDYSSAFREFAPAGTGDIAEVAMWNIALSDADVAVLALGVHPMLVHPEAVVGHWRLLGAYSPEINMMSNAAVMTMQGTLTASAHCRIFMPAVGGRRRFTTAVVAAVNPILLRPHNPNFQRHLRR